MEHFTHYTTSLSIELSLNQLSLYSSLTDISAGYTRCSIERRKFFIRTNLKLMSPLHTVHTERVKYIDYWPVFPEHRQYLLICMCFCSFFFVG